MSTQHQNIFSERIKAGNLQVTNFTASYISGTFTGKFDVTLPTNSGLKLTSGGFAVNTDTSGLAVSGSTLSLNSVITGNRTFVNDVTIQGILSVTGTQSISNVSDLSVSDSKITLLDGTSGAPTLNASIVVNRGNSSYAKILWDENFDTWKAGLSGSETNIILNAGFGLTKSGDTIALDIFNQGPTGSIGETGPQGNTGPQGLMGLNGDVGPQGQTGVQGFSGPQGSQGDTGPQGIEGPQGLIGPTGFTGEVGLQGPSGNQGNIGPQGQSGITGTQGNTGPQGFQGDGITGSQGNSGPQGEQGVTGPQGPLGGGTGSQGAQGTTGPQGSGLQGVTGPQGRTGPQGVTGNQGVTGPQGRTGPQGNTGPQGTTGAQGSSGNPIINITFSSITSITVSHTSGQYPLVQILNSDGSVMVPIAISHSSTSLFRVDFATQSSGTIIYGGGAGPQGSTGPQGFQGVTGPQGFTGHQGVTGPQGSTGPTGILRNDLFSSSQVTIEHGFGYYPVVQAFSNDGTKIYDADFSLTHSTNNSYTITFNNFGIGFTGGTIISGGAGLAFNVDNAADNRILTSNGTFTGSNAEANLTFDGSTLTVAGHTIFQQTSEVVNIVPGATATSVVYDFNQGSVWYHSSVTMNYSANFINLPTTNGRIITATIILSQGVTGYSPTTLRIDGVTQSIKWASNTYSVSSNKVDVVGFSFLRTSSSWSQVLGQISSFG